MKNTKAFGVTDVIDWVERHGSMQGRFDFFETFAEHSEFYQKIAKPLLSMHTVGSIDIERMIMIKPINTIYSLRNATASKILRELLFIGRKRISGTS